MKLILIHAAVLLSLTNLFGQHKTDGLVKTSWVIKSYYDPDTNKEIDAGSAVECKNFLALQFKTSRKLNLLFTDQKDTIIFHGKIVFNKNGTLQLHTGVNEIIYLGELEKCITASLRMKFRGIFFRTYDLEVMGNELHLSYALPNDSTNTRRVVVFEKE